MHAYCQFLLFTATTTFTSTTVVMFQHFLPRLSELWVWLFSVNFVLYYPILQLAPVAVLVMPDGGLLKERIFISFVNAFSITILIFCFWVLSHFSHHHFSLSTLHDLVIKSSQTKRSFFLVWSFWFVFSIQVNLLFHFLFLF